ncbi:MAG: hypothetical protein ACMUJM_04680 [bacterium]
MNKSFAVCLLLLGAVIHPCLARGIEGGRVMGKTSVGYEENEYDETLLFLNLYLDSQLPLPRFKRLRGAFRLQNGIRIIEQEENSLLNQADLHCALPIVPQLSSEILSELKHKTIRKDYGYIYWHSGLSVKYQGRNFLSSITYLYHEKEYGDPNYSDSKNSEIQFLINHSFSSRLTAHVIGKVESIRFSEDIEIIPSVATADPNTRMADGETTHKKRHDTLYEYSIGFQWIDAFLINVSYALQKNESNSDLYSYSAQQLSILAAIPLWWESTLQLYGRVQLRDLETVDIQDSDMFGEDSDDQLRNLLIISLSKDVLKNCSVELRYLLSRANLSSEHYKKQSYSCGFTWSF